MTQPSDAVSGVDYRNIDRSKVTAIELAEQTTGVLAEHDPPITEAPDIRGESVYIQIWGDTAVAQVLESLGTKCFGADEMRRVTGKTYYDQIAQDTVAMGVNDVLCRGLRPASIMMEVAAGSDEWFKDTERMADLQKGWRDACIRAGAAWGGGESPALRRLVDPKRCVLSVSVVARALVKDLIGPHLIRPNDAIILLMGVGIHANGLTSAFDLAQNLPQGFRTRIPDGRMYGEALLDATPIYAREVHACLKAFPGALHYGSNITGHGWRKLMRASAPWEYHMKLIPEVPPILRFLQKERGLSNYDAYSAYNMGAGYALFVDPNVADAIVSVLGQNGCPATNAGTVFESDRRRVIIEPLDVVYEDETLQLR